MPAYPNLLQTICDLGERMCTALGADDLDTFFGLMQERSLLVEELKAYESPADVDPDWRHTAAALEAQHKVLAEAMAAQEQRVGEALSALHRYDTARDSYTAPDSPSSILHRDVRG